MNGLLDMWSRPVAKGGARMGLLYRFNSILVLRKLPCTLAGFSSGRLAELALTAYLHSMSSTPVPSLQGLRDAYRKVTDRIAEAAVRANRQPQDVVMVAVTKTASPDQIRAIVEMGHVDLGENRVQQLERRVASLAEFLSRRRTLGAALTREDGSEIKPIDLVRWHMIGHLQRNKVKTVMPLVHLIHSVDTLRLAEELQSWAAKADRDVDVLLQVNVSGEVSKGGIPGPAAFHVAEQIDSMVHIRLRGLMTMAPYDDNPETSRPIFARTAEIFHDIREANIGDGVFNILSMGMTNDFEVAIEEGANLVRIGRALFGEEEQG